MIVSITVFLCGLIWMVGSGEAVQGQTHEPIYLADTVHINLNETPSEIEKSSAEETRETLFKEIKKFNQVVYDVKNRYMEEIDTKSLINAGIRGMLEDLDRFSVLMEKRSYEQLMESTSGKYEGLGMEIDSRSDYITIVTPMEGTPAYRKGLKSGDKITKIDGTSTKDMTTSDAAKLMRGTAGTSVNLIIEREGISNELDFDVERAVIELKSVNFYGVIEGTDIGYVRLSRFAEETSNELREAITELDGKGISSLIFDLRSNGGGLLQQAVETAELFVEEGKLVVYTRGKFAESERRLYSQRKPLFPDKPLVILVNEGTASASEIVSGAIQDWDRGIIMGYPTYGKGLVQQVFTIGSESDVALKLTTAKYYIPSGRCIQKPEKQNKVGHEEEIADADSTNIDSLTISEREAFYTNSGRVVYGGGGILPDVELEHADTYKAIELALERRGTFFNFAVSQYAGHPDWTNNFVVTDEMVGEFRDFMKEKEFTYKTSLEYSLDELKEAISDEEKDSLYMPALGQFEELITKEKEQDFTNSTDYIKKAIKREITSKISGQRGVYEEIILKTDDAILDAIKLLQDPEEFTRVLESGHDRDHVMIEDEEK
ncbi:MAG: S41 family peptidase [candidate division Zixibacteria bacterium]|nr:S41 family peptidase [candidate division Zixibacteria bacterium]